MDKIFKAYDIRGIYPEQINESKAEIIAKAFVLYLKNDNPLIVVGRDNRVSSDALFKAIVKGLKESGARVYNLGMVTTPMLYFATGFLKTDGGIMITASHNPKEYNGMKFVGRDSVPISIYSGLKEIREIAEKGEFVSRDGSVEDFDISAEYIKKNLEFLKTDKKFRIGIDTANAIAGDITSNLLKETNLEVNHYFKELDGNFPNHEANPVVDKNIEFLVNKVKENNLDLGIAFDGDGDRIIFIDELGMPVRADLILCLVADILKVKKVAYEIRNTKAIRDLNVKRYISKVGHPFLKEMMRENDIEFGGETSGHYFAKVLYFSEAPFFVLFTVLNYLAEKNITLSQAIKPYDKYFSSGDINLEAENKDEVINNLKEKYNDGEINDIDGIRIEYNDWWFAIRPSNTEPLLRLVIEADTKELLEEKINELKEEIKKP